MEQPGKNKPNKELLFTGHTLTYDREDQARVELIIDPATVKIKSALFFHTLVCDMSTCLL